MTRFFWGKQIQKIHFYKGIIFLADILLMNTCFVLTLALKFDGCIPTLYTTTHIKNCIPFTLIQLLVYLLFNMYKNLWRYASIKELFQLSSAVSFGVMGIYFYGLFMAFPFSLSIYVIYLFLLLINIGASRISYRILVKIRQRLRYMHLKPNPVPNTKSHHIMLVGAGDAASLVIQEITNKFSNTNEIILAVDDCKHKVGSSLHGIPIRGTSTMIPNLAIAYNIDEIIIAIPSASKKKISEIVELCNTTNCKLKIFPGISKSICLPFTLQHLRPVNIEDLLGRDEIILDNMLVSEHISNKTILVTGGGGSIGSELCRQIALFNPKKLIIFDIYENNAYDIQNELLRNGFPPTQLEVLIGSVRDTQKSKQVFATFTPDLVFHAAAHKHVPLMENSPGEAIKNNVFGTLNTALLAKEFRVKKFILISTDKAVNPTNVMGASKRLCEMIIQSLSTVSGYTQFAAVRFGNVLGSNGSVVPLFRKQLESGGPLTVTHPDIIRYFMTIPEAVRLILQAMTFAQAGEIFVLDMGQPVKILDLAKNFIKLSGLEEGKDIEIKFTGLRPGEKLYEELLMNEEGLHNTSCDKIFVGQPLDIDYKTLRAELDTLLTKVHNPSALRDYLQHIVPTYQPDYPHTQASSMSKENNISAVSTVSYAPAVS